jgi:hypothetical protein
MKKQDQIAALLEKYWEGESSLEEERILKAYFQNAPVNPRFEAEAALFRALQEEQSVEWSRHTEIKPVRSFRFYWAAAAVTLLLSAGIWWMQQHTAITDQPVIAHKSPAPPPNSLTTQQPNSPTAQQPNNPTAHLPTLQASVKKRKRVSVAAQTTPEDAEAQAAMEEIKAALALVSRKLKKGQAEINKGLREVEHVEIFKTKNSEG